MAKKVKGLPRFKSEDEEARFWETHSAADYWEQGKPVQVVMARPRKQPITIRINTEHLDEIKQAASNLGIPYQTLINVWLAERLAAERK